MSYLSQIYREEEPPRQVLRFESDHPACGCLVWWTHHEPRWVKGAYELTHQTPDPCPTHDLGGVA